MHATKIIRSLGITVGIVAGTAAAASAATGGGFIPSLPFHSEPTTTTVPKLEPTTTTITTVKKPEPAPTTTIKRVEPAPTTTVKKPEPTTTVKAPEPAPTTTVKKPEPAPTTTVKKPEPAPTTTVKRVEPTTTVKPTEPTTTTTAKPEVHTAATVELACHGELVDGHRVVTCEWRGELVPGARFLLLRAQQGGQGRVLLQSVDAHRFVDTTAEQGASYLYTVVEVVGSATSTAAHSNQVVMA